MVQGIEDYSLWNISNRINLRRGQTSTLSIRFLVFFSLGDVSCFHVFPGKGRLLLSAQGKKVMFSGKKIPTFQIIQEKSCAGAAPFGKTISSEGLKKISYFRVFFKKDHLSFSIQHVRSYFREKEISSFPIIQERSYSGAIFWKDHLFRTSGKRKYGFSCSVYFLIYQTLPISG